MARGSIFRRKNKEGKPHGNYIIKYKDDTGTWKTKTCGTNKHDADAELTRLVGQVDAGEYRPPKAILFRDLCDKWLRKSEATTKKSTYDFYSVQIERRLKPAFGHLQTRSISTEMIDLFISELLASKLKPQTVAHTVQVLKSIFKTAETWGYIAKSPAVAVKKPRVPQEEPDFYKPEEIARLLDAADDRHYPLLLTFAMTGARRSEVLGLAWSDVEWSTKTLHIRYQAQGGGRVELKTAHSRRRVPMSPMLIEALKTHQTRQIVDGGLNPLGLIFPSEAGTPILGSSFLRRIFWPTLTRADLRRLTPHSLRHSCATIRLAKGRPLPEVSAFLGHRDVAVTAKVYAHYLPRTESSAPDELETAIFGESDTTIKEAV